MNKNYPIAYTSHVADALFTTEKMAELLESAGKVLEIMTTFGDQDELTVGAVLISLAWAGGERPYLILSSTAGLADDLATGARLIVDTTEALLADVEAEELAARNFAEQQATEERA